MTLSDLQTTSYELLRVTNKDEVLCDIRLELRYKNNEGGPCWRIYDARADEELSSAGNWAWQRLKPRNLAHYRWETAEEALMVWNRGCSLPSICDNLKEANGEVRPYFAELYARIKAACAGAAEVKP